MAAGLIHSGQTCQSDELKIAVMATLPSPNADPYSGTFTPIDCCSSRNRSSAPVKAEATPGSN